MSLRLLFIGVIIFGLLGECSYRYYHFRGNVLSSNLEMKVPGPIRKVNHFLGKAWANVTGRQAPVTLLADHVLGCVPKSLMKAGWEKPEFGSPLDRFKNDVNATMEILSNRYARKGMDFIDNEDHDVELGGYWVVYVSVNAFQKYRDGKKTESLVFAKDYHATGSDFTCGNTYGYENQEDLWQGFAYIPGGEAIKIM